MPTRGPQVRGAPPDPSPHPGWHPQWHAVRGMSGVRRGKRKKVGPAVFLPIAPLRRSLVLTMSFPVTRAAGTAGILGVLGSRMAEARAVAARSREENAGIPCPPALWEGSAPAACRRGCTGCPLLAIGECNATRGVR